MKINNIDTAEKVFIIAEIGNNHEGSFALAKEMIKRAAEAGADAVKFQTIIPERLVSVQQAERIKKLKKFQLTYEEYRKLSIVAKDEGVKFLSTPFDIASALFLKDIVPAFKIASGDNDFFPLIEVIAKTGKPIIMSTGLANNEEIKKSVLFIKNIWQKNNVSQELALLHCVSSYPTSPENANLLAIRELEQFADVVGYSDHTMGIDAAVLSVAVGARIVEKHFTLDNNYSDFRDHQLSANPKDFKDLVLKVREAEKLMGTCTSFTNRDDEGSRASMRRSIAANKDLCIGHTLSEDDITWLRPGTGYAVGDESKVIGKKVKAPMVKGELIHVDKLDNA